MSLLRIDQNSLVDEQVSESSLAALTPRLEQLRSELTATGNPIHDSSVPLVGDDRSFFRLPEFQYVDYVRRREASDLGRIFQIANGLHDHIDSAIVLGDAAIASGSSCLMHACCDPYHNELSRALRGSKPRIYFQPNPHENDALASLILRLRQPDAEVSTQKRWAIIVLPDGNMTIRSNSVLQRLKRELREALEQEVDDYIERLVIPVDASPKADDGSGFELPHGISGANAVLSPAGMMPAALLGLDCMKLLEGAVKINDYFEQTRVSENVVLRIAAQNHVLAASGCRHQMLCVWSQSLETFGRWYGELVRQNISREFTTSAWVHPRASDRFLEQANQDQGNATAQHLLIQQSRCDPLFDSESQSMDEAMMARFRETIEASRIPSTSITLPRIDTFTLGQLFQLSMIVTWIRSRLAESNPSEIG